MKYNRIIVLLFFSLFIWSCSKENLDNADNEVEENTPSVSLETDKGIIEAGYSTEEHEFKISASGAWELLISNNNWIELWNEEEKKWENSNKLNGNGDSVIKFRTKANESFETKNININISSGEKSCVLKVSQIASPDFLDFVEDAVFRYAIMSSAMLYGMDENQDGKISAYESEIVPDDYVPYGIDAGGWGVKSIKGIEYFPHVRHLDLNRNDELKEVVITGNPDLMSLHIDYCPNLETVEIDKCSKLIEFAADFRIFNQVRSFIDSLKPQMHTLAIMNRQSDEDPSLDLSGYSNLNRLYIYDDHFTNVNLTGCKNLNLFSAKNNDFTSIDISDTYRDIDVDKAFFFDECNNLETIYVWKGWKKEDYWFFNYDEEKVKIVEKEN